MPLSPVLLACSESKEKMFTYKLVACTFLSIIQPLVIAVQHNIHTYKSCIHGMIKVIKVKVLGIYICMCTQLALL